MNSKIPKIGIVGGIGPDSTLYYYQHIINSFRPTYNETGYPEMIIESLNLRQLISIIEMDNWTEVARIIASKFEVLKSAGAEIGIIASNTPHKVFNEIASSTSLSLISIVTATTESLYQNNLRKPLLLGTKYTMQSTYYQDELSMKGITSITPKDSDQNYIQDKLLSEIEFGVIKKSTHKKFIEIIEDNISANNIDSVILGCTELPLIISEDDIDLPCIDTAIIHVDKVIEYCRNRNI